MNQVMIAIKNDYSDADIKSRWNAYRSELQKWNTARSYNREMINLYLGQPLWNTERDIDYFFRAWGQSLESAHKYKLIVNFECLEEKRDRFLEIIHSFNGSFGEAIQKGEIGSNKDQSMVDKNPRPPTLCLITT